MNIGRTSDSGSIMPGRGLSNPAFVIKLVAANDDMQQQPTSGRNNPNNDFLDNLKIGDIVDSKYKGKSISGSVTSIEKNELGDVVYVNIEDSEGETHKIEATRLFISNKPTVSGKESLTSSPAVFSESKFLNFNSFK